MNLSDVPLVILAAGHSSRMGIPKGLLLVGRERYWLEKQIEDFNKVGGKKIVLVLGKDAEIYRSKIKSLPKSDHEWTTYGDLSIIIVTNPNPDDGSFSSLVYGLKEAVKEGCPAALMLPVDVPLQGAEVILDLLRALGEGMVCIPYFKAKGGHPVLLRETFITKLLLIPLDAPNARLDYQIKKLPSHEVSRAETANEFVVKNLNTPEEWQSFQSQAKLP